MSSHSASSFYDWIVAQKISLTEEVGEERTRRAVRTVLQNSEETDLKVITIHWRIITESISRTVAVFSN